MINLYKTYTPYYVSPKIAFKQELTAETNQGNIYPSSYSYLYTNRDLNRMKDFYPPALINLSEMKGKIVFDIGAGECGQFVKDLRANGIDAHGIDKLASPDLNFLIKADAQAIPLEDNFCDIVYSTSSMFSFSGENIELKTQVLKEIHRVLKPNGKCRCSPVKVNIMKNLIKRAGLEEIFKILGSETLEEIPNMSWIEIKKIGKRL